MFLAYNAKMQIDLQRIRGYMQFTLHTNPLYAILLLWLAKEMEADFKRTPKEPERFQCVSTIKCSVDVCLSVNVFYVCCSKPTQHMHNMRFIQFESGRNRIEVEQKFSVNINQ